MGLGSILTHVRGWMSRKHHHSSELQYPQACIPPSDSGYFSVQRASQTNVQSSDTISTMVLPSPAPTLTPHQKASFNQLPLNEIQPAWFSRRHSSLCRISAETLKLETEFCKIELETGPFDSAHVDSSGIEMELREIPLAYSSCSSAQPYSHSSIYHHRDSIDRDVQLRNMILSPISTYFTGIKSQSAGLEAILYKVDVQKDAKTSASDHIAEADNVDSVKETIVAKTSRLAQSPPRQLHRKPKCLDLRNESMQQSPMMSHGLPFADSRLSPSSPSLGGLGLFRLRKSPLQHKHDKPSTRRPSHIAPIAVPFSNNDFNHIAQVEMHEKQESPQPRTFILTRKTRPVSIHNALESEVYCQVSDTPMSTRTLYHEASNDGHITPTPEMLICVPWQQVSPSNNSHNNNDSRKTIVLEQRFFHLCDTRRPSAGSVKQPGTANTVASSLVLKWWD